jgi:nucleolar protein 15
LLLNRGCGIDEDDDEADDNGGKAVPDPSSQTQSAKQRASKPAKHDNVNDRSNVIYVGHLPALFGERELVKFLKQFGGVTHVRLSRSVKTGGSKGYAFCRLEDADVAAIVADTLSGYLMFDAKLHIRKRLVCHVVPSDKVHPRLFVSAKSAASVKEARRQKVHAKPPIQAMDSITTKLVERERKKRAQLQEMGIDYTDFPGYEAGLVQTSKAETEVTPAKSKETVRESNSSVSLQKKRKESIESVEKEPSGSAKKHKKDRNDSVESASSIKSKDRTKGTREQASNPESKSSAKKDRKSIESSSGSTPAAATVLKSTFAKSKDRSKETPEPASNPQARSSAKKDRKSMESSSGSTPSVVAKAITDKRNDVVSGDGKSPKTPVSASVAPTKETLATSSTKKSKVRSESIDADKIEPNATISKTTKRKESIDKATVSEKSVSKLSATDKSMKPTKDKSATIPNVKKTVSSPSSAAEKQTVVTQSEKKAKKKRKDKNRRSV